MQSKHKPLKDARAKPGLHCQQLIPTEGRAGSRQGARRAPPEGAQEVVRGLAQRAAGAAEQLRAAAVQEHLPVEAQRARRLPRQLRPPLSQV